MSSDALRPTGAESLIATLEASGVDVCFTNPGTSEMHAVAAIGRAQSMRAILALFEGVATGAADGYGRMAGKPASTLLHLGPGLANGLANLHNARRAATPIVNIVGDHAVSHRALDAPLASDVAGFAAPVSKWIKSADRVEDVGPAAAEAVAAAMGAPQGIATLILPANTAWESIPEGAMLATPALRVTPQPQPDARLVHDIAASLKRARKAVILIAGKALLEPGLEAASRIATATGARIMTDTFVSRVTRGAGVPAIGRVPYFPEMIVDDLAGTDLLVLAGTKAPVAFFAYPGRPGALTPEGAEVLSLAAPSMDATSALQALADELGAKSPAPRTQLKRMERPQQGALNATNAGAVIAHHLPDNAIVVDEAATSGGAAFGMSAAGARHDWLYLTGGSIGMGLPLALGASIACPDRKTVCLHGDGGAMYTIQALWTMAREKTDVVTVIFANRSYAILKIELMRTGVQNAGPQALSLFDLANPEMSFAGLARAMGVEGIRAETVEEFDAAFSAAMKRKGPVLIEAVIP